MTFKNINDLSSRYGMYLPRNLKRLMIEGEPVSFQADKEYKITDFFTTREDMLHAFSFFAKKTLSKMIPFGMDPSGNVYCYFATEYAIVLYLTDKDKFTRPLIKLNDLSIIH